MIKNQNNQDWETEVRNAIQIPKVAKPKLIIRLSSSPEIKLPQTPYGTPC